MSLVQVVVLKDEFILHDSPIKVQLDYRVLSGHLSASVLIYYHLIIFQDVRKCILVLFLANFVEF